MLAPLRPSKAGLERREDSAALLADLTKLAAPFQTPKTGAVDVSTMRAGPLKDALAHALAAVKGAGEGGDSAGVYALRSRENGPVIGYAAIGYGGDRFQAWSTVSYLSPSGKKLGEASDEA